MGEHTKVKWADSTWNPFRGCRAVSAGCANCFAKKYVNRFGDFSKRVRASDATFYAPLRWNKKPWVCDLCGEAHHGVTEQGYCPQCGCAADAHRRRVFFGSLCDWLDDEVPVGLLADALDVIRRCQNLDFLCLTKRPELWRRRISQYIDSQLDGMSCPRLPRDTYDFIVQWLHGTPPSNIWLGVSVENQQTADERIPMLLQIPAAKRFVSYEPALEAVDFARWIYTGKIRCVNGYCSFNFSPKTCPVCHGEGWIQNHQHVDWLIVGGESGPHARPCNIEWIRSTIQQCRAAGIPCFVKQLGAYPTDDEPPNLHQLGFHDRRKCADPSEWPEDLRVQDWPR